MNSELPLLFRALEFAAHKHRDQRRKDVDATPYINHPIQLAGLLACEGCVTDASILAAAILHDTVEDTETTAAELEREFGVTIAALVMEVTDDKSLPKAERKRMQIEHAAHISHGAKLVKLADKICNVRDMNLSPPADWDLTRRREYFDWASAVVEQLQGTNANLETLFAKELARRP